VIDLEQVLLNLIVNAINAIEATEDGSGSITLSGYTKESGVYLVIRDTGVGIPEGLEEEVFNPLFTTRQGDQNMGLGLAIVRTILEAMGASISAKNHEEGGGGFHTSLSDVERKPEAQKLSFLQFDLQEVNDEILKNALSMLHGNKTRIAPGLGITRHVLLSRLKKIDSQNRSIHSELNFREENFGFMGLTIKGAFFAD
jgi:hypothetical protein